jgi:transcription-repair coupling factor (superfamily II helicase)
MDLQNISSALLPELLKKNFGEELMLALEKKSSLSVSGFAGSSPAIFAAQLFLVHQRNIVFVVENKEDALYATTELEELIGKEKVLYFPPSHLEPYQIEKIQNANLVLRTEVINKLNSGKSPKIIVAPYAALAEKVLKKADFTSITHSIKVGDRLDFDFLNELLQMNKFQRADFVSEPGEFSIRGGIVDLFSFSNEKPYRITFFGSEIESIKTFNIETQLSLEKVEEFQLVSNMNVVNTENKIPFFDLLPKDTFVVTKNVLLGQKQILAIYEKAEVNFEKLSKEINHQKPEELFLTDDDFLRKLLTLQFIDFAIQPLKGLNTTTI